MAEDSSSVANGALFSPRLELMLRLVVDCLLDESELPIQLSHFPELLPGREKEVCDFLEQRANAIGASLHRLEGPITITQLDARELPASHQAESTFALCAVITTATATTAFLLSTGVGLWRYGN